MKRLFNIAYDSSDNRYKLLYVVWLLIVLFILNDESGGNIRASYFTIFAAPIWFMALFGTPAIHTSLRSKRVTGADRILWSVVLGITSWLGYIVFRIFTKEKRLTEEQLKYENEDRYWFNFGLSAFSSFLLFFFVI